MASDEDVLVATWQHAEHLACGHMIELGFADAEVTPAGSDGGVDVRASGGIAQVKHFTSAPVGAPAVQQLVGAATRTVHGLFYALAGFTKAAVLLAEKHNVALFQYDLRGEIAARSDSAEQLVSIGFARWNPDVTTAARATFMAALQRYGQDVADISDSISTHLFPLVKTQFLNLREKGRIDEGEALLATVQVELKTVLALLKPLNGKKEHVLTEFLTDVARAEALTVQLAHRVGIDYTVIAESARRARTATTHE
jgi:hypothetical protein